MKSSCLGLILLATLTVATAFAQTATPGLEGDWQGALVAGPNSLRVVFHITKSSDGLYLGRIDSLDQGTSIPIDSVQLTGDNVRVAVPAARATFEGTLSVDKSTIKGTWTQGGALPLELKRATESATPAAGAAARPAPPPDVLETIVKTTGVPIDMDVPVAPIPVTGHGGQTNLIYELHMTNLSPFALHLERIEVLNGTASLVTYEGTTLNGVLHPFGSDESLDKRVLGPGTRTVAFILVRINPAGTVPSILRHKITADGFSVENSLKVSDAKPIVLGPPLRGTDWMAANGPSNISGHRRALMPVEGKAHLAQRFAIDWVKMGPNGRTFSGDEKDNKTHFAYGSEVLAVADATVVATKDGIPENVPGITSRAVPITLETIGGNHVILDLGGGRFAFYAHLQPGSLKVKLGDKVLRGQVLGLVGNSGNSTEPHLHFHVSDANSPLASEGLPYVLESFEITTGAGAGPRTNALPMQGAQVKFPER
jgi:murein DD-endopeptidase MepM/ murein hydrolase activator NlpD